MRSFSKKRQAENRRMKPARDEFLMQFDVCWLCERAPATEIHEMTPGAGRRRGVLERATWIATCRECHETHLQPFQGLWTLVGQLALKSSFDLLHYDRELVLDIKGWQLDSVTEADILEAVWRLAAHRMTRGW